MQSPGTTRILVFPVLGRRWAFQAKPPVPLPGADTPHPKTIRELWDSLKRTKDVSGRAEVVTDYVENQMQGQWGKLGAAPENTIRKRIYNAGLALLSRIKPSETFLKTIPRRAPAVEIVYPASLNPRLVRRRVRHVAVRGSREHRKLYYGSMTLLPFTSLLGILPVPNLPFFWNLFRAHAHWSALRGSQRLLQLTTIPMGQSEGTPSTRTPSSDIGKGEATQEIKKSGEKEEDGTSEGGTSPRCDLVDVPLVMTPSTELESLVSQTTASEPLPDSVLELICEKYNLDLVEVKRWRNQK